jgi:DNA invertase Pin-like site-specific DNA recombinase
VGGKSGKIFTLTRVAIWHKISIVWNSKDSLGRPKGTGKNKLDPYRPEIEGLLANGATQRYIANRYGVTETTLSRWVKKRGLKKSR